MKKSLAIVILIPLLLLFMFLLASWLIATFSSPLFALYGLPTLTIKTTAGGLMSFILACYVVDLFAPKK